MRALHPSNKSITQRMGLILPIALSLFFILSLPMAFADYPIIISESNINHNKSKELVYSVPKEYLRHIDTIEFKDTANNIRGYAWTKWNRKHICYGGKIILSKIDKNLLQHELGHIYEFCVLKRDYSTEEFADNFRIT